jgi:iron(III) transport system substrate-binding protein
MLGEMGVRTLKIWAGIFFLLGLLMGSSQDGLAASVEELIAGAKKEGVINFHSLSALNPQGAQELAVAFNKKYGLAVKVNYVPSSSFTKDTAKAISWGAMGIAPEWDLMTLTENLHADLWQKGLQQPFNYRSAGVDAKAIQHDSGSITVSHAVVLPAYNKNVLAAKDVPRNWESLLEPKWKDGKLGVSDATYYFSFLAAGPWGEKKTTDYVKGLAGQSPFIGRLAELYTRLQLGEILVAAMLTESFIHSAKVSGANVVFSDAVEPIVMSTTNVGVLKRAAHPNGAHLFAIFMGSAEAQTIWDKYIGQTSAFVPGTRTNHFVRGKKTVFMGGQDPQFVERLANEYSRILGFTR